MITPVSRHSPCFLLISAVLSIAAHTSYAAPRVLPKGKLPNDRRLGPLKDLNGYFPPLAKRGSSVRQNFAAAYSWRPACGQCQRRGR